MRILVCLAWVPLRPEVDPLTGAVAVDPRFSGISPADASALEWALRLAGATGGSVTAATVGTVEAEAVLRAALAAGAAAAVRVPAPADAPSRWVGAELAALAADGDLVMCGHASLDGGSGSVPAFVAHDLRWAQALGLVSLSLEDDRGLVVERRLDGGRRERLAVGGRAVLSTEPGPELRRAALTSILAAETEAIEVRSPTGPLPAGPTVVARRPFRPRTTVTPAPQGSTRDRLDQLLGHHGPGPAPAAAVDLPPDAAAALVVERLIQWGYLSRSDLGPDGAAC